MTFLEKVKQLEKSGFKLMIPCLAPVCPKSYGLEEHYNCQTEKDSKKIGCNACWMREMPKEDKFDEQFKYIVYNQNIKYWRSSNGIKIK